MFPQPNDADPLRSVLTFSQIDTFLALVEDGSVLRAADRLKVGRSTVSAHAKAIADEIGHHHFKRCNGQIVVSDAGLDAYCRFRGLLAHAAFCLTYFRSGNRLGPLHIPVLTPVGFPGSPLDRALDRASVRLARLQPHLCLLPTYAERPPATNEMGFSFVDGDGIADRWLLVRAGPRTCRKARDIALDDLAEVKLVAPRLPASLQASLSALAEQAGALLDRSDASVPEILASIAQSPKAALILPASLFNRGLADGAFDCRPIEPTLFDPALAVTGLDLSAVANLLTEELAAPCKGRPAERETLSLKYCRSFLALYEEGNVGRAAHRLSIVQPALTVQLHRIEELAGCSLFTRSHQGLRANPRADVLHRLLQPLVQRFATTLRDLRASPGKRATPIRIGLIPALDDESVMSQGFAVALDCWSRAHPDEVLQVMEGYSGTLLRWLQNGMVDFALVDRFVADPELVLEPMVEDKMAVVVAADSDLLAPGPVRLAELTRLPLVLPSARHGLRTLLAQTLSRHGLSLTPRIEVDSMAGCLNMVKIGRYATLLPMGSVAQSSHRRGVSIHEIRDPQILRTVCLARARNKPCGAVEGAFLDALRAAFGARLPGIFMARRDSLNEPVSAL
jgi:LysR family nitrogen assimilation transcriptional regulator